MNLRPLLLLATAFSLVACGPANEADHLALAECGSSACSSTGSAQWIEGEVRGAMYGMECIVTGMRDRTSGVYQVTLRDTFTNGSNTSELTIFVTPTGEAEVGIHRSGGTAETGEYDRFEPTQRCSLKPVSYFEACLAEVQKGDDIHASDGAWDCVYPSAESDLPWFEGCEELAPTCE